MSAGQRPRGGVAGLYVVQQRLRQAPPRLVARCGDVAHAALHVSGAAARTPLRLLAPPRHPAWRAGGETTRRGPGRCRRAALTLTRALWMLRCGS